MNTKKEPLIFSEFGEEEELFEEYDEFEGGLSDEATQYGKGGGGLLR